MASSSSSSSSSSFPYTLTMSEIRLCTHPGPVYDTNANRLTIDFLLKVQQIWLRGFNDM